MRSRRYVPLKEALAEATLENCLLKKSAIDDGRMAHEIPPPPRSPRSSGPSRYHPCQCGARWPRSASRNRPSTAGLIAMPASGLEGLDDCRLQTPTVQGGDPHQREVRRQIIVLALDEPELSPLEVAMAFTDRRCCYISEASVYRGNT